MIDANAAIAAQDEVSRRLVALGWAQLEPASPNPMLRYAFYLPGSADILPATWLMPTIDDGDNEARVGVAALVGFECPAAREVSTALLGQTYSGAVLRSPQLSIPLADGERSISQVEAVVGFVVAQQVALSATGQSRVIEMLRSGEALSAANPSAALHHADAAARELTREGAEVAVVMLAALGQYRDARMALASLSPILGDPSRARFVYQLGRWLDAEGSLSLPTSPARWSPSEVSPTSGLRSGTWSEHRARSVVEQEAVAATRALSRGKNRVGITALLEQELQARGLQLPRPAVERHVDFLLETRSLLGKARTAVRGIRGIVELVKDASSASEGPLASVLARDDESGHNDVVENAPLPAQATYPVASFGEGSAVSIDPGATRHLQDLMRDRCEVGVRVWLTDDASSSVTVHIGGLRIGRLTGLLAQRFAPPLMAAAERDELPWTEATISHGREGLELRLAIPS